MNRAALRYPPEKRRLRSVWWIGDRREGKAVTTPMGLEYRIVVAGSGSAAMPGQSVRIHETTKLADGSLIYSTHTKSNPVTFLLGGNQAIAGVDEGVTEGSTR